MRTETVDPRPVPDKVAAQASLRPVVRRALLVRFTPRAGKKAEKILEALRDRWHSSSARFLELVAGEARANASAFSFAENESVRLRRDGKTPMADFPRIQGEGDRGSLDVRLCIALCEDDLSSKLWVRVGRPLGAAPVPFPSAQNLLDQFRQIADAAGEWALRELKGSLVEMGSELKVARNGRLEVAALGINDQLLASSFESLADPEVSVQALLQDELVGPRLRQYLDQAAGNDRPLDWRAKKSSDLTWFSFPTTIAMEDDRLESRQVLYLMRSTSSAAQALGVGVDDSIVGDLAHRSALKVGRWIANRV